MRKSSQPGAPSPNPQSLQKILRLLPALALAALIFLFSGTPGDQVEGVYHAIMEWVRAVLPSLPGSAGSSGMEVDWLKAGHAVGYFLLGMAVLFALPEGRRTAPGLALLLCALYAFSDELHQVFVPGRSGEARDVLIDTFAALSGVALVLTARIWKRQG